MLDRAARTTVRNFSTLFLVCVAVMLPLEMGLSFTQREVIRVHELVPFIEELPDGERIEGIGADELEGARLARTIVTGLELALIPLLIATTRRVLDRDAQGRLPTATDAYRNGLSPPRFGPLPAASNFGAIVLALGFSLSVGFAAYQIGRLGAEVFPDRLRFAILGGVESIARSVALPWALVTWVQAGADRAWRAPRRDPFADRGGRTKGPA